MYYNTIYAVLYSFNQKPEVDARIPLRAVQMQFTYHSKLQNMQFRCTSTTFVLHKEQNRYTASLLWLSDEWSAASITSFTDDPAQKFLRIWAKQWFLQDLVCHINKAKTYLKGKPHET